MKRDHQKERQRTLERYQELYEQDPELRVVSANADGDLELLKDTFFVKRELNILDVTPKEKWNWLHSCNLNNYAPAPLAVVKFYIQHGVEINAQDIYGMTPLHYAMRSKNVEAAIALLNAGADPNIPDIDRATALAYINGMPEELALLKLMLEKGGDVHFNNGQHGILEGIKKYRSENPKFKPVIELMEKYT